MNHCQRERERFSDIMEMYCGSRLGFGAICLGGVAADATDGWFFRIEKAISRQLPQKAPEALMAGIRQIAGAGGADPDQAVLDADAFQFLFRVVPA